MRWGWLALLAGLVVPGATLAQAVRVTSGDHVDFTRLVIEYPGPVDWKVGRTADGYELRLPPGGPQYDLSGVFDLIGKDRLASIWSDPETGALQLGIACACFAIPFEFRPGTVVIDIRNGTPPKGSSFETPLEGGTAPDLAEKPAARPVGRPRTAGVELTYDWTDTLKDVPDGSGQTGSTLGLDLSATEVVRLDLEPLRRSLIEQLSRGATSGVVDMAKPSAPTGPPEDDGNPSVEVRVGEAPNLVIRQKGEAAAPLGAAGLECIEDGRLEVAAWAGPEPFAPQFGPALTGLTGEFDRPDPEAVKRAAQFYLSMGFGAEARAILRAFPTAQEDAALWQSMSRILDGEPDPNPVFQGMAACDTAAALWAILADPSVLSVGQVEKAAILRAFSALPIHLRQDLGPTLVDRFLAMKDFATATALRDAVLRGTSDPGPGIELMEAAIEKASGASVASTERLEDLATQSGPNTPDALAALIIQRAELGQDVSFEQVTAMEVYAKEREGSEDHDRFHLALTLAYGASGDFDRAFAQLPDTPEGAPLLWKMLAFSGKDSALLDHAVLAKGEPLPQAARTSATLFAQRMMTLGLAEQAADWLALANDVPPLLAARVALGLGDAARALDLVGEDATPPADEIRIKAWHLLGDDPAIAALYADRDDQALSWRAVSRMRDWERLASDGPAEWKAAATQLIGPRAPTQVDAPGVAMAALTTPEGPPAGPLEASQRLIDGSVATRDAILALLDAVRTPDIPTH